jgi:transmembrane sensor
VDKTENGERGRQRRIEEEAAIWWSRFNLGTADQAAFDQWRDADPARAVAFARVQASWEALAALDPDATVATEETALPSRRRFLQRAGLGAAAATLGGVFFASRALAWDHASTGVGEFKRINLPDASILELNTATKVSWRFSRDARHIRLDQGEIAVMLVGGPQATLATATRTLALSPGRFNVRAIDDEIGVTVLRGRAIAPLAESSSTAQKVVDAGQTLAINPNGLQLHSMTVEDRAMLTAWQSGDIVFDNTSLQHAVDEYNRYLSNKIVVDAPVRELRVGGRFATTDPNAFLRAVSIGLDLNVRHSADGIEIAKK